MFTCEQCKKEYAREGHYKKHLLTHAVAEEKKETKAIDAELAAKEKKLMELENRITGAVEFCPPKIRAIIDEELGEEFKANVKARDDVPQFELTIYVPEEYSTMTTEEKTMSGGVDIRHIVVSNAEWDTKTRTYCQLIKQNIKQNMQAHLKK